MYDVNKMAGDISKDITQEAINESFGVKEEKKVVKEQVEQVVCKTCGFKVALS